MEYKGRHIDDSNRWIEHFDYLHSMDRDIHNEIIYLSEEQINDILLRRTEKYNYLTKKGVNFKNLVVGIEYSGDKNSDIWVGLNWEQQESDAEKDERIKTEKNKIDRDDEDYSLEKINDAIAYLGKYGFKVTTEALSLCHENKEVINMSQPKFKVGDYVANDDSSVVAQIEGVSTDGIYYTFKIIKPSISYTAPSCEFVDRYYHLWTINDAKEGDVVANETIVLNDTIVLIVDHLGTFENRPIIYSWYFADSNKFYGIGPTKPDRWEAEGFTPATKEQRDLLFQKMKEAGYEWDKKTRQLVKQDDYA